MILASYLPHTKPTPYLPHTYPKQPLPTLYLTYSKVRICQGALVSIIPPELKKKHRERSFFLAKEYKSGVKNVKILYVRDSLFFMTLF